jgi:cell filamentation protein
MSDKYGVDQDPYCYPGTSTLINLLEIRDEKRLLSAEREQSESALSNISFSESPYDLAYLRSIHRTLFSAIYAWAGELRTVDISLGDTRFCTCSRIEAEAKKLFAHLAKNDYFVDLSKEELITKIAALYSDVNVLHPFRDGNGRAQRIVFEHIILNCGYSVSWQPISRDEWVSANIEGYQGRNHALAEIFSRCIGGEITEPQPGAPAAGY